MKLTQKQIKVIANDVLKFIKQICGDNNITFYLAYGTALGAVRHKGFIPWDDDIDIFMTREEYNRFAEVMRTRSTDDRYRLLYIDTKTYTLPIAKVIDTETVLYQDRQREFMPLGVYVDVFILDNIPDDVKVRNVNFKKLDRFLKLWRIFQYKREYSRKNFIKRWIYNSINPRWFTVLIDKEAQKYNSKITQQVGVMTYPGSNRKVNCFPRRWIETKDIVQFENEEYFVFGNVDEFLTQLYGDWNKLPPVESRKTHHAYRAFYVSENKK